MTPQLKEDHHGVIPYQAPRLSLDAIESELAELMDLRETAEAEGELPETLAAIDEQIKAYMAREVKKVDGICHAIRTYELAAEYARKEADRLYARAIAFEARVERIKNTAKLAMQTHGGRVIETPTNTLRVQGNGGLQPLDVAMEKLEDHFKIITVTLPLPVWKKAMDTVQLLEASNVCAIVADASRNAETQPANEVIRQALKLGPVEGARLLERGQHLRVE